MIRCRVCGSKKNYSKSRKRISSFYTGCSNVSGKLQRFNWWETDGQYQVCKNFGGGGLSGDRHFVYLIDNDVIGFVENIIKEKADGYTDSDAVFVEGKIPEAPDDRCAKLVYKDDRLQWEDMPDPTTPSPTAEEVYQAATLLNQAQIIATQKEQDKAMAQLLLTSVGGGQNV